MHLVYSIFFEKTTMPDIPVGQQSFPLKDPLPDSSPKLNDPDLSAHTQLASHAPRAVSVHDQLVCPALPQEDERKANVIEKSVGVLRPEEIADVYTELADPDLKTDRRTELLDSLGVETDFLRVGDQATGKLEVEVVDVNEDGPGVFLFDQQSRWS